MDTLDFAWYALIFLELFSVILPYLRDKNKDKFSVFALILGSGIARIFRVFISIEQKDWMTLLLTVAATIGIAVLYWGQWQTVVHKDGEE